MLPLRPRSSRCWRCGSCDGRRRASRSSPSGSSPPATAASSRCSTARTSCSRSPARSRSPTSSRRRARDGRRARTTCRWSRARSPRRTTPSASSEVRAQLAARWSRSAPARPPAASRRCATSPTSSEFISVVYAPPEYISTLATSTPISRARAGRLRAARLPDRQAPAARGDQRLPRRAQAGRSPPHSVCIECKLRGNVCVMVAHGTPCLGPGDPRRLRRALPRLRPRLLRLLRADGDAEHAVAERAAARARHGASATSCASTAPSTPSAEPFREESRAP